MKETKIIVENLSKIYHIPTRQPGLKASIKSMFSRTYTDTQAVKNVSFTIEAGEMIGFIGPNGAGKTTTLKMLSGLLYPSSGTVNVSGYTPWNRQPEYLKRISMVMGNKSQMMWDIPPLDTFRVLSEIYQVPQKQYEETIDHLTELLEMKDLLLKPVRNLSLGERMKCELVAALLHQPDIIFLDEPTLGLDISMQHILRKFIAQYNQIYGATIILTSHYMADVTELCSRIILIHHGQLIFDGALDDLRQHVEPSKLIRLKLTEEIPHQNIKPYFPPQAEINTINGSEFILRINRSEISQVTAQLLNNLPILDLTIENPPIEAIIDQIYQEGVV